MQSVKIVVTGPFNAGKTTFIKSVSEITVLSTERQVSAASGEAPGETTVAMDFGRITISDDVVLYLFGTPGQQRFSFMWETLSEGMLGFILLVDVANQESLSDAKEMIQFFTSMSDVPFVIGANRCDDGDEGMLSRTRNALELGPEMVLLPVNARDRASVKGLLIGLLQQILETMA